jgi:TolA-binding protein
MLGLRRLALLPAVVVMTGGCFATRGDVRVLQADIATLRAEAARADSAHRAQLAAASRQVGIVADSLRAASLALAHFSSDVSRFQGDLASTMHTFGQGLIAVQEQMGQSQRRLQELRTDFEARSNELAASAAPGQPSPAATGVGTTGPLQLLQAASSQFDGGRNEAARAGYEDFLTRFPTNEQAPFALYRIAQTYDFELKPAAADSVYQLVTERFPKSDQAPTALYKRAMLMLNARPSQVAKARPLFQQIVDKYPGSPEAELARDRLKTPH